MAETEITLLTDGTGTNPPVSDELVLVEVSPAVGSTPSALFWADRASS